MATRRVIVQELVTVDGFVAGDDGGLDFFEGASDYAEVDADNIAILREVDTILLGRTTYEMFVEYWPSADGEVVASAVNSIPKIVFSATLDKAPWGAWEPAQVLEGDAVDHVRRLREEPGGTLMVWGSITLARALLAAGLVDELQLRVVPITLGGGMSLLGADVGRHDLTLVEAKPYRSGIASLRYGFAGAAG
ncbi:MAG: reductase [Streptosporangiales bacterium]|nr:reductase [Streptosporangiales bacterium]